MGSAAQRTTQVANGSPGGSVSTSIGSRQPMTQRGATILAGLLIAAAALAPAAAAQPIAPYDGHGPFNCQLQDVGTGTDYPDPGADPLCVEYDKTQQNVTDFGIFEFLSKEPARVAAAVPKCFYFQRDHWTGSVVQGAPPELWHWDGSYFFDKSNGSGGVHVANFRIGGQPMDATPYAPPEFQPYLEAGGGGGAYVSGEVQTDPSCAAKVDTPAERAQVYYHTQPGGPISRQAIGPFALGVSRSALHRSAGPPHELLNGTERYNVTGGGQLRLAYVNSFVAAILTTSPRHFLGDVHPGVSGVKARQALHAGFAFAIGDLAVFEAPRMNRSRLLLGIRAGSLKWIVIVDAGRIRSQPDLKRTLAALSQNGRGRVDSTGMPW
jgi:hypothetical protein